MRGDRNVDIRGGNKIPQHRRRHRRWRRLLWRHGAWGRGVLRGPGAR
jgi:hypothetical protein